MNVIVLAKYVPNPNGVPEMGPDFLLVREGVEGALDPGDEFAVEAGLQLTDTHGGEVTIVSMGPEAAMGGVRKALSMGADRAVLVTDDALRGADTLVTARALAKAIGTIEFDVVVAGVESTDGYTGTLPMTVAELLGVPSVTFARKMEVDGDRLKAERQTELGYDVVEAPLPVLVTVTAGATDPRYPTLKGIMQAKQKPVERYGVSDLGLSPDEVTSTQRIRAVDPAPEKGPGEIVEDSGDGAARIAAFLQDAKVL